MTHSNDVVRPATTLTGACILPVALDAAWRALNDTTLLQEAIPGCESMVGRPGRADQPVQTAYDVVVGAAVGPIKAKFRGTLELTDLAPLDSYVLHFAGSAGFIGSATGRATVALTRVSDAATRLTYVATAEAAGRVARVGPAVIDRAARRLIDHFFERFAAALARRPAISG